MESTKHLIQITRRLLGDMNKTQMNWYLGGHQDFSAIFTATIGIILFALLYALLRCMCQSVHGSSSDHQSSINENPPLDEELATFPIIIYGAPTEEKPSSSSFPCSTFEAKDCAICLDEYGNGDAIRVLPKCQHIFHKECLEKWIQVPSLYCPICRSQMLERSIQPPRTNCSVPNYPVRIQISAYL